jgi:acetyl-CoA carboxylase biotin carboxylase subunit
MDRALSEFRIEGRGVKTTISFHRSVLADERFRSGDVSTDFLEHFLAREEEAGAPAAAAS